MERWLHSALDYLPHWLEFQMLRFEQPGCVIAIAHNGRVVRELAYGHANIAKGAPLTPRHRFRVASHSKSFTAAGILRLRERRKLHLDDTAGQYVRGLHPGIAQVTLTQLLTHTAGITRDGPDSGQFGDRRPYLSETELRRDLERPPTIEANTRFKYSNHGYGLLGLVIESVTGEPYRKWIQREIVDAVGLTETQPDAPIRRGTPFANGHSGKLLLGHRVVIPAGNVTHAMAPAAGFVSTAADLARYFGQLSPHAKGSVLSVASRRELARRQWRNPHSSLETWYGLGTIGGTFGGWDWFGHAGSFQGTLSQTSTFPGQGLTISVLTNASDGFAAPWLEGTVHILRTFSQHGAPGRLARAWSGRCWSLGGAVDLVPFGKKVLVANPAFFNPFLDASELAVQSRDRGRIALAGGFGSHGEPVRLVRSASGAMREIWLGGSRLVPAQKMRSEMEARYGTGGGSNRSAKRPVRKS